MFFIILVVRDIGEDNTSQIIPLKNYGSQSRESEANGIGFDYHNFLLILFDWYYPHLYNYLCKQNRKTRFYNLCSPKDNLRYFVYQLL